jgi:hypothetical protein
VATIAQVKERASARAHRASLQTELIEIHGAEVLAVAAVLPLDLDGSFGLTFEVNLSKQVAAIFTLDWTLARSEKSTFVFRAEYSHFRSSLQGRVTVQVVLRTKHVIVVGGNTDSLKMINTGERFADTRVDLATKRHKSH